MLERNHHGALVASSGNKVCEHCRREFPKEHAGHSDLLGWYCSWGGQDSCLRKHAREFAMRMTSVLSN